MSIDKCRMAYLRSRLPPGNWSIWKTCWKIITESMNTAEDKPKPAYVVGEFDDLFRGDVSKLMRYVHDGHQILIVYNHIGENIGVVGTLNYFMDEWHVDTPAANMRLKHVTQPWYFYSDIQT